MTDAAEDIAEKLAAARRAGVRLGYREGKRRALESGELAPGPDAPIPLQEPPPPPHEYSGPGGVPAAALFHYGSGEPIQDGPTPQERAARAAEDAVVREYRSEVRSRRRQPVTAEESPAPRPEPTTIRLAAEDR